MSPQFQRVSSAQEVVSVKKIFLIDSSFNREEWKIDGV